MKHAVVDSEKGTHILEDTNHKSLGQLGLSSLNAGTKRKALEIEEQEEAIIVAQGLPEANPQVQQQGLFYGNYAPPNLPPVPSLRKLIEICSKPFEKQLTNNDVKDNQSRLAMSKEHVKKHLIPLLNENEDLSRGIQVTTYDLAGKEYPMVFKIWVSKIHVLTSEWKTFCHAHGLVKKQDFVTVWMFRNIATGKLCFVIKSRRLQVFETIKRKKEQDRIEIYGLLRSRKVYTPKFQ